MTEAVRRTQTKVYYDVQLRGGLALAGGAIVEMQTGEGKTITTALPAFFRALWGRGVHVGTTNAYLAERDFQELTPAFNLLGMSVGHVHAEMSPSEKRQAYRSDVTYGPGYEFGFDFLRDQIAMRQHKRLRLGTRHVAKLRGVPSTEQTLLQPDRAFAILDEADSVLLDEATSPLVLSGAAVGTRWRCGGVPVGSRNSSICCRGDRLSA